MHKGKKNRQNETALFRDLHLGDKTTEKKGSDFHTNEASYWRGYLWDKGEVVIGKECFL